ncbi:hypothetical protein [Pseudomonas sp. NPDC090208]|uniref:hypothetical protein n=1 Tax=Pseudomonas sp. NPDC090208 TaxID=3364478 RepID=UPI0037FCB6C3
MAKIEINQEAGHDPREKVEAFVKGRSYPFTATLTHKNIKPLVVPSTGVSDVIKPGEPITFKVKNFEQLWVVVTDCATLAQRFKRPEKDFAVLEAEGVAEVVAEPAAEAASADAETPAETTVEAVSQPKGGRGSKTATGE